MLRESPYESGFTLIELLMVIGIILILCALLLPVISRTKTSAGSTACRNKLRQMGMALQMYAHDQKNRYPHYLGPTGPAYGDATGERGRAAGLVYWSSKLSPYGVLAWTNTAFHCPGYRGEVAAPGSRDGVDRHGGYAYNTYGVRTANTTRGSFGLGPIQYWERAPGNYVPAVAESQVVAPSEMLAIGDSLMKKGLKGASDVWSCVNLFGSPLLEAPYAPHHGSKDNQSYVDGHVSANKPEILYDPAKTASWWNYDHQPHNELWGE
jgi:prepilin-type N-terminal cleavage/methylation domain-containing protein